MKKIVNNDNTVQGAGGGGKGGGGSGRVAQEAPNTLRSKQFARLLDLICEGEVEGFPKGNRGLFFDETPIENEDGSFNFQDFSVVTVKGIQAQEYIPGFTEIESESVVSVEVKNSQSVTRRITNSTIDAVRVTISVPRLTNQNTSNGDLNGSSVQIAIDLQTDNGGFVQKISDTIEGKTTTKYQRAYRIELTGSSPWDIRVRRLTADSEKSNIQNQTFWDSFTEIVDTKFSYPNSAIAGIQIDSEQFSAIPKRAYLVRGLRVRVPSNYNPITRVYTGTWDGTFKIAWTDNPAWCFYDLVIEKRYGLGDFISDSQVDKWELFTIGQYCDKLVDDGFGGKEPRFTCNLYLQTRAEAYNVLLNMASIFRGILFWGGGALIPVQDSPQDAMNLFTPANVVGGVFSYSGSAKNTRHTVALVSWNDPDDFYRQKVEYVEDVEGILLYGVNKTEIVAFGCISRGQANRLGKWLLLTETLETDTVSFGVGLDGSFVVPGRVIKIQDPARAGKRFGGRIKSATLTTVELDSEVEIESGKSYILTCVFPDGTIEEQDVTNSPGFYTTLNTDAFSQVPQDQAIWVLAADDLVPQQFRVVSVSETGKAELAIVALKYNPGKFAAVESGLKLEPLPISGLLKVLSAPVNLVLGEYQVNFQGELQTVMTVSWDAVPQAVLFQVKYRRFNENYIALPETSNRFIEVLGVDPGTYQVSVIAVSTENIVSPEATVVGEILGSTSIGVMPDVTGLKLVPNGGTEFTGNEISITWDAVRDDGNPDNSVFENFEVRIVNDQGALLRVEHVTDNFYIYSFEDNVSDANLVTTPSLPSRFPVVVSPFAARAIDETTVALVVIPISISAESANLKSQLDADDESTVIESGGVGTGVSNLNDKSGNGNGVSQGTPVSRPATNLNTMNGRNVISFDGVDDFLENLSFPASINMTIFIVVKVISSDNQFKSILSMDAVNDFQIDSGVSGQFLARFLSSNLGHTTAPLNSSSLIGIPSLIAYRLSDNDNNVILRINGIQVAEDTYNGGLDVTQFFALGRNRAASLNLEFDFAESLIYDKDLTLSEMVVREAYLADKWFNDVLPVAAQSIGQTSVLLVSIPEIVLPIAAQSIGQTSVSFISVPFVVLPIAAQSIGQTTVSSVTIT